MDYIVLDARLVAPAEENLRVRESRAHYQRRHRIVVKLRNKAYFHLCADCGNVADDWSTVKDTNGSDPFAHYEPRCRRCHMHYDGTPARLMAGWVRWRAACEAAA
jgi:hypothetical protein